MKYLFEGNSNPDDFISEHYLKLISEKGENLLHRKNNKKVFSSPQDLIRIPRGKKIIFKKKEKFGLSDENGNILIQPKQDELFYFGKNYYIIQKKGVYQIIDSNEKIILTLGNKLPEILDGELWLVQVSENYLVINSAKCEILYSQKAFSTKYNKESETLVFSDENIRSFFHLKSGKIIFRQTISE